MVFRAPLGPAAHLICSGACGATGFPGAFGPGRPRDRHTLCYRSEWSISKPALALRTLRRPPNQWCRVADVWLGASSRSSPWPCRRPPAPRPARPLAVYAANSARHVGLKPGQDPSLRINVARNSPSSISNVEFASLELQRFGAFFKTDRVKLRATYVWLGPCRCLQALGAAPWPLNS